MRTYQFALLLMLSVFSMKAGHAQSCRLTEVAANLTVEKGKALLAVRNAGERGVLLAKDTFRSNIEFPATISVYFVAGSGETYGVSQGFGWSPAGARRMVNVTSELRSLKPGETLERRFDLGALIRCFQRATGTEGGRAIDGMFKVIIWLRIYPHSNSRDLQKALEDAYSGIPYPTLANPDPSGDGRRLDESIVFIVNVPGSFCVGESRATYGQGGIQCDPESMAKEQAAVFTAVCAGPDGMIRDDR